MLMLLMECSFRATCYFRQEELFAYEFDVDLYVLMMDQNQITSSRNKIFSVTTILVRWYVMRLQVPGSWSVVGGAWAPKHLKYD